jgi:ferredoxin-NADP reductase
LETLANGYPNIKVVYVLSKPPERWAGESGYIAQHILEKHLPEQSKRFMYFICGPEPMMDAMEKVLLGMGVPGDQIQTERFNMV